MLGRVVPLRVVLRERKGRHHHEHGTVSVTEFVISKPATWGAVALLGMLVSGSERVRGGDTDA
jgi:hypothetical protein